MRPYKLPKDEILFAAKSGFLTKKLWDEFFNPHTQGWSSIRWKGFKSRGLFIEHSSTLVRNCLILNKRSPDVKKIIQSEPSSPPIAIQVQHDEIVARIVLTLKVQGLIDKYFLEPELRKLYQGHRQNNQRISNFKLPDAIFDLNIKNRYQKTALEVENSKKNFNKYKHFVDRYSVNSKIEQIIIAYRNPQIKRTIERAMTILHYPQQIRPIHFVEIDDLYDHSKMSLFIHKINSKNTFFNIPKSS